MNGREAQTAASGAERRLPHVVAITSGKGGVGKSSIAVNLGIALSRRGLRVCLLDADTGLANVNILLGLTPHLTLEHVLFGAKSIDEVMLDAPGGLTVIPGANGISECVSLQPRQQLRLTRELARIESDFDYFLIDTAAGIAEDTLEFVAASQQALIVITPEPTSLTDAFSLVKLMARRRRNLVFQVVVNMCGNVAEGREVYQRFSAAVKRYVGADTRSLGHLLRDESLRNAVTLQRPVTLFPDTDPSCRSFLRLADTLDAELAKRSPRQAFSGYWYRRFQQRAATRNTAVATQEGLAGDSKDLAELETRLLNVIEERAEVADQVAPLLERVTTRYVQRYGHSHLDVAGILSMLRKRAASEPDALADWARILYSGISDEPSSRRDDVVLSETGTAIWTAGTAAEPWTAMAPLAPESPSVAQPHSYDDARFGDQQRLVERLRALDTSQGPLRELLGRLALA